MFSGEPSPMSTEAVQRFQCEVIGLPLCKLDSYLYAGWHFQLYERI
jgi:hypothetical protein